MTAEIPPLRGSTVSLRPSRAAGQRLRQARTDLAASEEFVAETLGLSLEAYRSIEDGHTVLSPRRVILAAQLFGVRPSALCIDAESDAPARREPPSAPATIVDLAAVRLRNRG